MGERVLRRIRLQLLACLAMLVPAGVIALQEDAPIRIDGGRFTIVAYPSDAQLARSMLASAQATDTFPGLPRPSARVLIAIAPDSRRFREWIGPAVPEWGAAVAFPGQNRIIMQGHRAGSDAGPPLVVLRHELAHLALNEFVGVRPPRWFDEGYASYSAGEWKREQTLAANLLLLFRGTPPLDSLNRGFGEGSRAAAASYALAHVAVAELAALDPDRGLMLFFRYWGESGSMERAVRRAYGITLDGFEDRWQARTRRRFGAVALFAELSLVGAGVMLLFLPVYLSKRNRNRERLRSMRASEEAAELLARESFLAELVRRDDESESGAVSDPPN